MSDKDITVAGTNISSVKSLNSQSGMSYNEAKAFIARTTGGHGTKKYSTTDVGKVRREIQGKK
ncbi:gamma-type small acid-soluble spore protein [Radiobacillus sp. PE A8.2]|uniref:gamma-type small acid-soluble spore protein n=1 Tax=Radiobacillus sp. PE A8.2 TaxID=3380349 RepID=UPI00388D5C28